MAQMAERLLDSACTVERASENFKQAVESPKDLPALVHESLNDFEVYAEVVAARPDWLSFVARNRAEFHDCVFVGAADAHVAWAVLFATQPPIAAMFLQVAMRPLRVPAVIALDLDTVGFLHEFCVNMGTGTGG